MLCAPAPEGALVRSEKSRVLGGAMRRGPQGAPGLRPLGAGEESAFRLCSKTAPMVITESTYAANSSVGKREAEPRGEDEVVAHGSGNGIADISIADRALPGKPRFYFCRQA